MMMKTIAVLMRGRGRVPTSHRSRRPRRSRAGRRRVLRRGGSGGRAIGDSRSQFPLSADEITEGWSEDTASPHLATLSLPTLE